MVNFTKQKQRQKQQLQTLLPPELATLETPLGRVLIIKGGGTFIKGPRVLIFANNNQAKIKPKYKPKPKTKPETEQSLSKSKTHKKKHHINVELALDFNSDWRVEL